MFDYVMNCYGLPDAFQHHLSCFILHAMDPPWLGSALLVVGHSDGQLVFALSDLESHRIHVSKHGAAGHELNALLLCPSSVKKRVAAPP